MGSARSTEEAMRKVFCSSLAVLAVFFFAGAAGATRNALAPVNGKALPAPSVAVSGLTAQTTAQLSSDGTGQMDFDALSVAGDPLFREGSKEFLQQLSKGDSVLPAAKPALRDALNSVKTPAVKPGREKALPLIRKPRAKTPSPADPIKSRNAL
jgi:hypothetical protein